MKKETGFLHVLSLQMAIVCTAITCLGQPITVPVQRTISTPYGNVNYTTNQTVGYMHYGTTQPSKKYKFTIVLKNDSTFTVSSRIDISEKKHFIKAKLNKKKVQITPDQTKEVSRMSYMQNDKLVGIPADTCWLFLSIQGRISAYAYLSELNSEYLAAVKKYNGPIVMLTRKNLEEMLEGHEKAMKHLEKGRYKKAIEAFNER